MGVERAAEDDLAKRLIQLHRQRRHQRRDLAAAGVEFGIADAAA